MARTVSVGASVAHPTFSCSLFPPQSSSLLVGSMRLWVFARLCCLLSSSTLCTQLLEFVFLISSLPLFSTALEEDDPPPRIVLRMDSILVLPLQTCRDVRKKTPATPTDPHIGLVAKLSYPFFPAMSRNGFRQHFLRTLPPRNPRTSSVCLVTNHYPFLPQNEPIQHNNTSTKEGQSQATETQNTKPNIQKPTSDQTTCGVYTGRFFRTTSCTLWLPLRTHFLDCNPVDEKSIHELVAPSPRYLGDSGCAALRDASQKPRACADNYTLPLLDSSPHCCVPPASWRSSVPRGSQHFSSDPHSIALVSSDDGPLRVQP